MFHLRRIEPDKIVLERGSLATDPDRLYVDCSASAVVRRPIIPVFEGDKKLREWIQASRLDGFSGLADGVQAHEADKIAVLERFGQSAGRAVDNIKKLLAPPAAVVAS